MPHGESYPTYSAIAQRLREYFGIPGQDVNVDVHGVVLAGDISPPPYHFVCFTSQGFVAAERAHVGIGVDGGFLGKALLEISKVRVLTTDTAIDVFIKNDFSGWDTTTLMSNTRSRQQGFVQGVRVAKHSDGTPEGGTQYISGLPVTANEWFDVPGTYFIEDNSVFYASPALDNKTIRILADVKVLLL